MPLAAFAYDGRSIDYTPTADVAAGDVVVQGELGGGARGPIAANTPSSLTVVGVFDFPKTAGSGSAIAVGTKVYWDATNKVATATVGSNKYLGKTTKAATDADTTVRVRMSQ